MSAAVPPFTPDQKQAWRADQKRKVRNVVLYGWRLTPVFREASKGAVYATDADAAKPELVGWVKQFTHPPGALLIGAPNRTVERGETIEGQHYLVWSDRSLRRISKANFELLGKVPAETRVAALTTQFQPVLEEAA